MNFSLNDAIKIAGLITTLFAGTWFFSGVLQTQPLQIANLEKQLSRQGAMIDKLNEKVERLDRAVDRLGYSVYGNGRNGRRQTFPNRNGK